MGLSWDLHQHTGTNASKTTFCWDFPAHIKPISTFSELLEGTGIAAVTVRAWQLLPEHKGEMTAVPGACLGVCSANPQAFIDYKPCPKIIS